MPFFCRGVHFSRWVLRAFVFFSFFRVFFFVFFSSVFFVFFSFFLRCLYCRLRSSLKSLLWPRRPCSFPFVGVFAFFFRSFFREFFGRNKNLRLSLWSVSLLSRRSSRLLSLLSLWFFWFSFFSLFFRVWRHRLLLYVLSCLFACLTFHRCLLSRRLSSLLLIYPLWKQKVYWHL